MRIAPKLVPVCVQHGFAWCVAVCLALSWAWGWPGATARVVAAEKALPKVAGPVQAAPLPDDAEASARGVVGKLTLADLESLALAHNPALVQAAAQVRGAEGRLLQAGLYPNPRLAYEASEMGNEGQAGQQGGFVRQEVITARKRQWDQAVARYEVQQARHAWEVRRLRVLTDVRRAYYEVLAAQQAAILAQQLVRLADDAASAVQALVQAQEAARTDLLQARIEAESARVLLEKSGARQQAAWRRLAAVVGVPDLEPRPLEGRLYEELQAVGWDEALQRLSQSSPELAAARAALSRAQAQLARQCAGRFPNLAVQAGVQRDTATRDTIAGVQVELPLPLFDRNQGNIMNAQAELAAAQAEVRRVELALQQRLTGVFEQYEAARQEAERYQRHILPQAEEALRLVQTGYREGEFGYLALLTAQRTYVQTQLAWLEAVRKLRAAQALLEGYLLEGSLQGPAGSPEGEP